MSNVGLYIIVLAKQIIPWFSDIARASGTVEVVTYISLSVKTTIVTNMSSSVERPVVTISISVKMQLRTGHDPEPGACLLSDNRKVTSLTKLRSISLRRGSLRRRRRWRKICRFFGENSF